METSESLRTGRLSVVLPAYNEEESVPLAADVIGNLLTRAGIDHELIFVNDGSRDHTWRAIQEAAARRPQVRGIRFSRNFGKEAAIFAGLAQAKGDCCVVLDCDLQHPPEKILEMYRLWQQGWQVVEGVKISRGKESPLHTLAAKTFYRFLSGATRIDMSHASDFKLLDRRAVDVLVAMREKNAFFRALSSWIGSNVPVALVPVAFSLVAAFMSFFSSTTGVVTPALFPLIPALAASTGLDAAVLFACTVLGAQSSAISPFSSGGSLILGSCGKEEERNRLFNRLLFVAVPISVACSAVYNVIVAMIL